MGQWTMIKQTIFSVQVKYYIILFMVFVLKFNSYICKTKYLIIPFSKIDIINNTFIQTYHFIHSILHKPQNNFSRLIKLIVRQTAQLPFRKFIKNCVYAFIQVELNNKKLKNHPIKFTDYHSSLYKSQFNQTLQFESNLFMQDFQKSQCLYHPSENITNFCKEKTCLMPLCPTCICSHLELHLKGGKSTPQFDNINDSYAACSKEIKTFSEKFEEGRTQLNSIQRTIIEQKKQLSDIIYKTKVEVRDLVEATFDQLQKQLQSAIDQQNRALGLHLPENLDTLQKGIIQISSKLREMNGDLRTDSSLSTLITFSHQTRANLQKYKNDIFKEIRNNQQYCPLPSVNTEAINRLKQAVSQCITLKFNFPQAIKQQQAKHHHSQQLQQTHQTQHPSKINQQLVKTQHPITTHQTKQNGISSSTNIQAPQTERGINVASGLGTHPNVIKSPTKSHNLSSVSGGIKGGDVVGGSVGQNIGSSFGGSGQIRSTVGGSTLQGGHKRSQIKSGSHHQKI